MVILGIETSCDDTSVALLKLGDNKLDILSNIVSSQINIHNLYGGVVPEVASRAHIENMIPVLKKSLRDAKIKSVKDVDLISTTCGPGLVGSLVVGINTAKTLAFAFKKPLVCVNHLEGHIYANLVREVKSQKSKVKIKFPLVVLIVSGGHTMLVHMKDHLKYKILGETKDDAAGEAFDKVARVLNLGYPGGPIIEKLAEKGDAEYFKFPRAEMEGKTIRLESGFLKKLPPNLDFSFSGLKTSVINEVRKKRRVTDKFKKDISASFQEAVVEVLVQKTLWAAERKKVKTIFISGGVAANSYLKEKLKKESLKNNFNFFAPPKILCTDNAAMIAAAGYFKYKIKGPDSLKKIKIDPNLRLK